MLFVNRRIIISTLVVIAFTANACVKVMPPSAAISYQAGTDMQQITSVAASVLQEHDFVLSVLDPEMGVVVTDWRRTSDIQKENLTLALVGERYQRRMRVSLVVNKEMKQISLKPTKQKHSSKTGWMEDNLDEKEKALLEACATDLAARLGLSPDSIVFTDPLAKPEPTPTPPTSQAQRLVTGTLFAVVTACLFFSFLAYNS